MNGGLTADVLPGLSVALRARYLDDRPAIEDRSLVARGYFLLDLIAQYRWRKSSSRSKRSTSPTPIGARRSSRTRRAYGARSDAPPVASRSRASRPLDTSIR
jgi:hypothetical protein